MKVLFRESFARDLRRNVTRSLLKTRSKWQANGSLTFRIENMAAGGGDGTFRHRQDVAPVRENERGAHGHEPQPHREERGLIGVGPGRGVGLLFVVLGIMALIIVSLAFLNPRLRRFETELPDAVHQNPEVPGAEQRLQSA